MVECMSRIRLIIDTEEEIRMAVWLAAKKRGLGVSEFVNELLRAHLKSEIQDARKYVPKDAGNGK